MMTDRLNVGLIGLGYWGSNYRRIIGNDNRSTLLWCCDTVEHNLQDLKDNSSVQVTTDYVRLLDDPNVDAVVVVTPTSSHYRIVKNSLLAGKHVLVEKPLATTSAECKDLGELADKAQKQLMVGHVFKFNAAFNQLQSLVAEKELGNMLYLHCKRTGLGPIRTDVNVLCDLASHDIYMLNSLIGEMPNRVSATGACYLQENVEDVAFLTLKYSNNVFANVHVSWLDPYKVRTMTVVGDKKMAVFDDVSTAPLQIFDKGASYQRKGADFGEFKTLIRDGDILFPCVKGVEPLKAEFNHFIDCVLTGQRPLCEAEEGMQVAQILEVAQQSIYNNSQEMIVPCLQK